MTIAYSNKYDLWTTRYSFEPTCYARTGNTMLSSKENGLWKHDVNENRCRFYDVDGGASIDVFSNQDPSAIKAFNALSIETNINSWTASVYTNEEYTTGERQEGQVDSFDNREGFKYAEMPRSVINSTGNISPIPIMFVGYYVDIVNSEILSPFSELGEGGDQSEYILVKLIAENQFPIDIGAEIKVLNDDGNLINPLWNDMGSQYFFDTDEPTYVYSTGVHETGFFEVIVAVKKGSYFYDDEGALYDIDTTAILLNLVSTGSFAGGYLNSFLGNSSTDNGYGPAWGNYNPFLLLQLNLNSPALGSFLGGYYNMTPFTNGLGGAGAAFPAFAVSNSAVNGDQMRGPYARVKLETQTTEPLELHAINVDYSFSKLDSRLNQNS
jgi:hypothetical protein